MYGVHLEYLKYNCERYTGMNEHGICLHEEQFLGQSRAIERLEAEITYKKEKLDDLKEDNRRMEEKIDEIKECVNELIIKSKTDDDRLEKRFTSIEKDLDRRLTAIETRQEVLEKQDEKNRSDTNLKLAIITVIFGAITTIIAIISFYLSSKGLI